jgi:hypothetical protein
MLTILRFREYHVKPSKIGTKVLLRSEADFRILNR